MPRLFVALELDPSVRAALLKLEEKLIFRKGGFSKVPEANMHMTLLFLGEVSDDAARKVTDDFSKISFPKFEYRIRGISVFPNQNFVRVVWAGCETAEEGKFDSLYGEVCQKLGTTSEEKFVPHVTLARVKTRDASAASAEFVRAHERLDLGTTLAARLVLKQSVIVNYSPPRYSDVASVGLS